MNRLVYLLGISFLLTTSNFAQSSNSWSTYTDLEKVKIEYQETQCNFEDSGLEAMFYFLKLTNKTATEISVSFKIEYYFNGECTTCHNDEYYFTFVIPANGSLMPTCTLTNDNGRLAIIKEYLNRDYGSPLDKFELTNISVQ